MCASRPEIPFASSHWNPGHTLFFLARFAFISLFCMFVNNIYFATFFTVLCCAFTHSLVVMKFHGRNHGGRWVQTSRVTSTTHTYIVYYMERLKTHGQPIANRRTKFLIKSDTSGRPQKFFHDFPLPTLTFVLLSIWLVVGVSFFVIVRMHLSHEKWNLAWHGLSILSSSCTIWAMT